MNHPITNHQLARIKQAEFLQEVEAARATRMGRTIGLEVWSGGWQSPLL